ncbi:MAG: hypothetical protein MR491_05235 [Mollicutes bacterium]|nr:hypothetical protein [Mollicutes bacterium]
MKVYLSLILFFTWPFTLTSVISIESEVVETLNSTFSFAFALVGPSKTTPVCFL